MSDSIILCAVQDSPVSFDLEATLDKVERLAAQAAFKARHHAPATSSSSSSANANVGVNGSVEGKEGTSRERGSDEKTPVVVVFPEAFISAYPRGMDFGAIVGSRTAEGRAWFARYHASSVPVADVDGAVMRRLRAVARDNNITLVIGVIERCDVPPSGKSREEYGSSFPGGYGTLYCSSLTISPAGELLANHRKLQPTGSERLVWGQGDGAGIRVVDTPAGRVGSCICWENYMPLHRMALYSEGVEVYCAPTADTRETWTSSMKHIAAEGRCFVISCCQFNVRSDFPKDYPAYKEAKPDEVITRGGSVICGPLGEVLAGPLFDERGVLVTRVQKSALTAARMDFDPVGHYARPDVFSLQVDRRSKSTVISTHD